MQPLTLEQLASEAKSFRQQLQARKSETSLADLSDQGWYPFDTLSCFETLGKFLEEPWRSKLLRQHAGEPILDLGCGDGDLALFLEAQTGAQVHAVDFPASNFNQMAGVYRMKEVLDSNLVIAPVNLDQQFVLPQTRYGIAFFLGVLYHLKNPIYVLEALAESARYCVFSTKINQEPGSTAKLLDTPDETNFWEFSQTAMIRLLERCGWRVVQFAAISDPHDAHPKGRFFALLQSYWAETDAILELGAGWHATEHQSWRWTERRFSATLRRAAADRTVALDFSIPEAVLDKLGPMTMRASINGGMAGLAKVFGTAGEHTFEIPVPEGSPEALQVTWELDKAYPASASDPRELAVQVCFARSAKAIRLIA